MTQFILRQSPFEVLFRDFFNTESFFNNLEKSKPGYPVDIYEDDEGLKINCN
jgi:HSP20 family molecular chaperone IbpA